MKTSDSIQPKPQERFRSYSTAKDQGGHEDRAFLVIVTLVLIGMYVVVLLESPGLRAPGPLIILTGLMALHIFLYWAVGITVLQHNPLVKVLYLVLQGAIALSLTLFTKSNSMIFGLYPALIGVTIGMLRPWS